MGVLVNTTEWQVSPKLDQREMACIIRHAPFNQLSAVWASLATMASELGEGKWSSQ